MVFWEDENLFIFCGGENFFGISSQGEGVYF